MKYVWVILLFTIFGFSVGDELGFKESISNVEVNRRRSAQGSRLQAAAAQAQQAKIPGLGSNAPSQALNPPAVASLQAQSPNGASTIPPFKPIPPAPERPFVPNETRPTRMDVNEVPSPALVGVAVPAFNSMPSSISRLSVGETVPVDSANRRIVAVAGQGSKPKISDKLSSTDFALRQLATSDNELPPPLPQTSSNSIQALLAATNLTEKALEAALIQRQKLMVHSGSTSTTTYKPATLTYKYSGSVGKVMNAPKEYYPVGYDKNFDDNFASRVELPDTSFSCGDQKHFPGLYADEDLGCMVFHVCALTDDGLIMKSFLCPESTLFDQTILKCNWWFYVDCKNSKKLYDSNIPISKSYQLMKALTFFSSYKKDASTVKPTEKD